jgi:hypothetical protein
MFNVQFITNFTIKTCFEKLKFLKNMCSQNGGNAISETQILKISCGGPFGSFAPPLKNPEKIH